MEMVANRGCEPDPMVAPGVAWFVSPHGLGHAARAAAVMNAIGDRCPEVRHHLFTTVPKAFFAESVPGGRIHHRRLDCDVGMVQRTAFDEDVEATVDALDRLCLEDARVIDEVAEAVAASRSSLVVSDIAPLGLMAARRLGLPAVLIENFTWDWIYRAYGDRRLERHGRLMAEVFQCADLTIQTEPWCRRRRDARIVAPVSRVPRRTRSQVRSALGIPDRVKMVLLSTGCSDDSLAAARRFELPPETVLVAASDGAGSVARSGRVLRVTGWYHPDLVRASDLVVGKLGYSTVAEVFHAATAFAFLPRSRFPESRVLETFVREHMPAAALSRSWTTDPAIAEVLQTLLAADPPAGPRPNGAAAAAEAILDLLDRAT